MPAVTKGRNHGEHQQRALAHRTLGTGITGMATLAKLPLEINDDVAEDGPKLNGGSSPASPPPTQSR